jgi:hypothetical protein
VEIKPAYIAVGAIVVIFLVTKMSGGSGGSGASAASLASVANANAAANAKIGIAAYQAQAAVAASSAQREQNSVAQTVALSGMISSVAKSIASANTASSVSLAGVAQQAINTQGGVLIAKADAAARTQVSGINSAAQVKIAGYGVDVETIKAEAQKYAVDAKSKIAALVSDAQLSALLDKNSTALKIVEAQGEQQYKLNLSNIDLQNKLNLSNIDLQKFLGPLDASTTIEVAKSNAELNKYRAEVMAASNREIAQINADTRRYESDNNFNRALLSGVTSSGSGGSGGGSLLGGVVDLASSFLGFL